MRRLLNLSRSFVLFMYLAKKKVLSGNALKNIIVFDIYARMYKQFTEYIV